MLLKTAVEMERETESGELHIFNVYAEAEATWCAEKDSFELSDIEIENWGRGPKMVPASKLLTKKEVDQVDDALTSQFWLVACERCRETESVFTDANGARSCAACRAAAEERRREAACERACEDKYDARKNGDF